MIGARGSARFSSAGSVKRMSSRKMDAVRRLSNYRASLYEETQKDLKVGGMTAPEIDDAGFGESNSSFSIVSMSLRSDDMKELEKLIEQAEEEDQAMESKKDG